MGVVLNEIILSWNVEYNLSVILTI